MLDGLKKSYALASGNMLSHINGSSGDIKKQNKDQIAHK